MSALERVASEGILVAGGGRAILLQIAHPSVGAGVAAHSDFARRPMARLRGTLMYVYAQVFGDDTLRSAASAAVDKAHSPVKAEASGDSPAYDAADPALQLWVAATLYDTAVTLHEKLFGKLSEADADAVYEGYAVIGTGLQMPSAMWPRDRAAFAEYWAAQRSLLRVTADARRTAQSLLHPERPIALRPVMPLARLVTAGLLDDGLRQDFGLTWTPARQRRFERFLSVSRRVVPLLPARVRYAPRDAALRQLRSYLSR